jgi:lysophospholipase L1-like esterase
MKRNILAVMAILIAAVAYAQPQVGDWAKFNRYHEANKEVTTTPRVVFMGDSITDYWVNADPDFFKSNNFLGRGISGQTTAHMLVRFRRDVIDFHPKYVVILAGTNDIAKNNGDITLENILGNIESMCELAKAHKIKPIICSVLPAAAYRWRKEIKPADEIVKLNGMLYEYAKSKKIPYVDYHSVLKDENNGLPEVHAADGVHPNIDCYKIMENIILDYIK